MKDMIKRIREEREGFTLAELLIVVAIIAVLVAIAIPVFNGQLEKSRDAVTVSNLRTAYAEAQVAVLTGEGDDNNHVTYNKPSGSSTNTTVEVAEVKDMGHKAKFESGTAEGLPFTAPDSMGAGKGSSVTVVFTYDANMKLTTVATK